MTNLKDYLKEYAEKQLRIIEKIELPKEIIEKIKDNKKDISLKVYAESYCPDCRAIVGILENFSKYANKLNIEYIDRTGNEEELYNLTNNARIPSIIKENQILLIEFPDFVLKKLKENPNNREEIIYNFRVGKYNEDIILELYNKIF